MYKLILLMLLLTASFSAQGLEYGWKNEAGNMVNASSLEGKPVLLHFWASWCPPCRKEMPALIKWIGEHPDAQVVVLSLDSNRESAQSFFKQLGVEMPLNMSAMREASSIGVRGLPSTFIVDAQGKIIKRHIGDINWADQAVSDEVLSWL